MNFSTTLKELMKQKQITNYRLAAILDVSQTTVANWLNEKNSPTLENLIDMSNFFDVSLDYLIKGEEKMKEGKKFSVEIGPMEKSALFVGGQNNKYETNDNYKRQSGPKSVLDQPTFRKSMAPRNENKQVITVKISGYTDVNLNINSQCPICHYDIHPQFLDGIVVNDDIIAFFMCPSCHNIFAVRYSNFKYYYAEKIGKKQILADGIITPLQSVDFCYTPFEPPVKNVPEELSIPEFSKFADAYRAAQLAEAYNLLGLIEMAYRRTLEFLLKDYLCFVDADNAKKYEEMQVYTLLNDEHVKSLLDDETLTALAIREEWLGNDYTHYVNYHPEFDYKDMITIFDILMGKVCEKLKATKYISALQRKK